MSAHSLFSKPGFYVWLFAVPVLLILQYKLWFGAGGVSEQKQVEQLIEAQSMKLESQHSRNAALEEEVKALKDSSNLGLIESRARTELGYIRSDETFFQFEQGS